MLFSSSLEYKVHIFITLLSTKIVSIMHLVSIKVFYYALLKTCNHFGINVTGILYVSVTRPRIIHFSNTKVNPGQPSTFNCTVASFPTPLENELRLMAPIGKRVTLLQSIVFDSNIYTRSSLFQVFFFEELF